MPPLSNASAQKPLAMWIPLASIVEKSNVRFSYNHAEIVNLAESIMQHGQIMPVSVKPADENGNYELVCGHRRYRAVKYLAENGQSVTQIKASVISGNTLILQLIENIQRVDISQEEKEAAIQDMAKTMSQSEIAKALNKSPQWVSDVFAGIKVRNSLVGQGMDTAGMSTKALAVARRIPAEDMARVAEKAKENGGTVKAMSDAVQEYRKEKEPDPKSESWDNRQITVGEVLVLIEQQKSRMEQESKDNSVVFIAKSNACTQIARAITSYVATKAR